MLPNLSLVLLLKFQPKSQRKGVWKRKGGLKIPSAVTERLVRGHGINGWKRFASWMAERDCDLGLLILQLMLPLLMMKLLGQCMLPLLDSTFQMSWVTHSSWSLQRNVVCFLLNHALIRWEVMWYLNPQLRQTLLSFVQRTPLIILSLKLCNTKLFGGDWSNGWVYLVVNDQRN